MSASDWLYTWHDRLQDVRAYCRTWEVRYSVYTDALCEITRLEYVTMHLDWGDVHVAAWLYRVAEYARMLEADGLHDAAYAMMDEVRRLDHARRISR